VGLEIIQCGGLVQWDGSTNEDAANVGKEMLNGWKLDKARY
jgi:hypothetical protein